jgi:hypothetical protein
MNTRRLGSGPLVAALLAALALSIVWAGVSQIDDPYVSANPGWNGTSELIKKGVAPANADITNTLTLGNPSALMIIAPTREFTLSEANSIRSYVEGGGLLVLADNFGSGNQLLGLLNVSARFDHRLLADTLFYYKEPIFPLIVQLPPSNLFNGVSELALNTAVTLNITSGSNVRILATSTPFSFLDINQDNEKEPGEPSGPFPVLAELGLGQGEVILFTSPASFTNGMINLSDNTVFIDNLLKAGTAPTRTVPVLDEAHLESSPFSSTRLLAKQIMSSALSGGMSGTAKLGFTSITLLLIAARYGYRRPFRKKVKEDGTLEVQKDIDPVMRLHPSWTRKELDYVQHELEAGLRWRFHEKE